MPEFIWRKKQCTPVTFISEALHLAHAPEAGIIPRNGLAWNYAASPQHYYYPGFDPNPYTLELITMLDNAGKGISYGSPLDFGFVYFEDFGSIEASCPGCSGCLRRGDARASPLSFLGRIAA
jgi:hypothetical protein